MWTTWRGVNGGVNHSGRKHSVSRPERMATLRISLACTPANSGGPTGSQSAVTLCDA
jgi:hypothetical protein